MAALKRAVGRFGGIGLLNELPKHDIHLELGPEERNNLNSRLRAIEVDIDVQSGRRRKYRG